MINSTAENTVSASFMPTVTQRTNPEVRPFGIDMMRFARKPAPQGLGCIFRQEHETREDASAGRDLFGAAGDEDWRPRTSYAALKEKATMGVFMKLSQRLSGNAGSQAFDRLALQKVGVGLAQIDRHAVLVTDRLHGRILATLLGKPYMVIDNFYGKIANFIDAFGADEVTLRADSYEQARAMAGQMLEQQAG